MADLLHLLARARDHSFSSVAGVLVPLVGSGAVDCSAVLRPQPDEVADFLDLRRLAGAERPAWHLNFDQREVLVRPVAGDRWTDVDGRTFQLRGIKADGLGLQWLCVGFLVEPEAGTEEDVFMVPLYFAGIEELGL